RSCNMTKTDSQVMFMERQCRRIFIVQVIGLIFVVLIASILAYAAWESYVRQEDRADRTIALQQAEICAIASVLATDPAERKGFDVQSVVDNCLRAAGLSGIHLS